MEALGEWPLKDSCGGGFEISDGEINHKVSEMGWVFFHGVRAPWQWTFGQKYCVLLVILASLLRTGELIVCKFMNE